MGWFMLGFVSYVKVFGLYFRNSVVEGIYIRLVVCLNDFYG